MKNWQFMLIGVTSAIASTFIPIAPLASIALGFGVGLISLVIIYGMN